MACPGDGELGQADWLHDALSDARAFADATGVRLAIDLFVTRVNSFSPTTSQVNLPSTRIHYPPHGRSSTTPPAGDDPDPDPGPDPHIAAPLLASPRKLERALPAFVGSDVLGRADVYYARPRVGKVVDEFVRAGGGRTLVLACGPERLGQEVREAGCALAGEGCDVVVKVETFSGQT